MGEFADMEIDRIINDFVDRRSGLFHDFDEDGDMDDDIPSLRHRGRFRLTPREKLVVRIKSGGATRAAHDVGRILTRLLKL